MSKLKSQAAFFERYNIKEDEFKKTGLTWEMLSEIYDDYAKRTSNLEDVAASLFRSLSKMEYVHSVRYRVKNAEHLIEKIIRKKMENPEREITVDTYLTEITDLIGIRVLHLFKDEWSAIHQNILNTWDLKEQVVAYYRTGDDIRVFEENACTPKEHRSGYRSIHYTIKCQLTKLETYAEVQVRTIFEEAWSEIDHTVRYPYDMNNPLLGQYLLIFNRLAGSADEMGSFILNLRNYFQKIQEENQKINQEKEKATQQLQETINKLKISDKEKKNLERKLNQIQQSEISTRFRTEPDPMPWMKAYNSFDNIFKVMERIDFKSKIFDDFADVPEGSFKKKIKK